MHKHINTKHKGEKWSFPKKKKWAKYEKIYKKKEKQKIKTAYGDFFLPKILKSDIGQEIKTKIRKKQKQKKMLKKLR